MYRWLTVLLLCLGALIIPQDPARAQDEPAPDGNGAAFDAQADEQPSPLLSEPESPEALFDAVVLMLDLERPNLAERYLKQLLAQDPGDETILRMRDKHGPAVFLELANDERLQPESVELLERMNAAFRRFAADPARLDRLLENLVDGTPQERELAIIQLRNTGEIAVPRMLTLMSKSVAPVDREAIVYALARMGSQIEPALRGALQSPDEGVKTVALDALGRIGSLNTVPWLLYPAFGDDQALAVREAAQKSLARILFDDSKKLDEVSSYGAASRLKEIATTHFRLEYNWPLREDGETTELWGWNRKTGRLSAWNVTPKTASLIAGSRFAWQALSLSPQRKDLRSLYLAARLAFDAHLAGWENPLPTGPGTAHNQGLLTGAEVALDALSYALRNPNPAAALGCLQVLSQVGSRNQLRAQGQQASPIIQAMNYPNFRVQFAAASTVLQLDPRESFRGASRVVDILMRALNDTGDRHGLAIDPNQDRAATMAGLLGEMGYEPLQASTGQDGFSLAAKRSDVTLVVIHAAVIRWGLTQTIANFRADARTAGIPIIVYGPESVQPDVDRLASQYPLIGFALPGEESFKRGVRLFLSRLETPPLTEEQRAARTEAAGFWLAHIASGRRTDIFNIAPAETALFDAVNDPGVGENAVLALGAVSTTSAQERLQEIATSEAREAGLRETAALQLAFHIQKHGVLLSKSRLDKVHSAWQDASAGPVRTALASVVGSFGPTSSRVAELLQELPVPTIPSAAD